jgi:hypothetical protein
MVPDHDHRAFTVIYSVRGEPASFPLRKKEKREVTGSTSLSMIQIPWVDPSLDGIAMRLMFPPKSSSAKWGEYYTCTVRLGATSGPYCKGEGRAILTLKVIVV